MCKENTDILSVKELLGAVSRGEADEALAVSYGTSSPAYLAEVRQRIDALGNLFFQNFEDGKGAVLFCGPGRTEIGGNHTDHQHGCVLCAGVDLDLLALAVPRETCQTPRVRLLSEGYPVIELTLSDLEPKTEEAGTSAGLVRGIAAKIRSYGYSLCGFDVCITSRVPAGSGLSSSAAYEVLVGNLFSYFSCQCRLSPVTIAQIGQYAENEYFGKPCGLMDQMGSSLGGVIAIDFLDPESPVIRQIPFDPEKAGYLFALIDTYSDHGDLTDAYAAIPAEMKKVASCFGKEVLREVAPADFYHALPSLRKSCGDRAVLRAMHFFEENERAKAEANALEQGNVDAFLALVNASGLSSELLLQNIWIPQRPQEQTLTLALAQGRRLLAGTGAIRVHGGGFAGTLQAFVPKDRWETFRAGMEELLGEGCCRRLRIRPTGAGVLYRG